MMAIRRDEHRIANEKTKRRDVKDNFEIKKDQIQIKHDKKEIRRDERRIERGEGLAQEIADQHQIEHDKKEIAVKTAEIAHDKVQIAADTHTTKREIDREIRKVHQKQHMLGGYHLMINLVGVSTAVFLML